MKLKLRVRIVRPASMSRWGGEKDYVPRPAVVACVVEIGPIAKAIAVLVCSTRKFIVERDPINSKLRKCVKLVGFRDAIVVGIDPKKKSGIDRVAAVDNAVSIAAIFRLVEFRQGKKAIGIGRCRLGSEVAKQLRAIVDSAVAVPVQSKEGVGGTWSSPANLDRLARVKQIELHAGRVVCKVKP